MVREWVYTAFYMLLITALAMRGPITRGGGSGMVERLVAYFWVFFVYVWD